MTAVELISGRTAIPVVVGAEAPAGADAAVVTLIGPFYGLPEVEDTDWQFVPAAVGCIHELAVSERIIFRLVRQARTKKASR